MNQYAGIIEFGRAIRKAMPTAEELANNIRRNMGWPRKSIMKIVVKKSVYSKMWYWRIYTDDDYEVPIIASNGFIDEAECRANLDLVRRAFVEEKAA